MAEISDQSQAAEAIDPPNLTRIISLSVDTSADGLLRSDRIGNSEEELSIPRETIADVVHSTRFHAELLRPIRLGTYGVHIDQPAELLCFHFSFQRTSERWLTRVRAATIEIDFLDAPLDGSNAANPSVAKFHPVEYEGPTSNGQIVKTTNASLSVAPPISSLSLGTGHSQEVTLPLESKLYVHGVRGGWRTKNNVTWTINEDRLKKDGLPREMCMPIIVTCKQPRRFSAQVTVSAHYALIRGQLAKMIPVIGKMDEPLYFDPATLRAAIEEKRSGPDGTPIAMDLGNLNDVPLSEYSSFPGP